MYVILQKILKETKKRKFKAEFYTWIWLYLFYLLFIILRVIDMNFIIYKKFKIIKKILMKKFVFIIKWSISVQKWKYYLWIDKIHYKLKINTIQQEHFSSMISNLLYEN